MHPLPLWDTSRLRLRAQVAPAANVGRICCAPRLGARQHLSWVHASSCTSASTVPLKHASVTHQPETVISQLVGKQILQLNPAHSTVPLLHPIEHQLPFAAALQIYSSSGSNGSRPCSSSSASVDRPASELVALHYVISGSGYVSSSSASDMQQAMLPGDSIISLQGAATFSTQPLQQDSHITTNTHSATADPHHHPAANSTNLQQNRSGVEQQQQQEQSKSPAWSQLLAWLHQIHAKHQQTHQGQQEQQHDVGNPLDNPASAATTVSMATSAASVGSSKQLVMLQLLLPSELLTGELLAHHAGHYQTVAQHLPWSIAGQRHQEAGAAAECSTAGDFTGVVPVGSINKDEVCWLLVDTSLAAATPAATAAPGAHQEHTEEAQPQPEHLQHHEHAAAALPQHNSSSSNDRTDHAGTGNSSHSMDPDINNSHNIIFDSSCSAAAPFTLSSPLSQHHVLKRALSEAGAFRLPHQTNRLALLFGPHASPAVSISFGVEVFEPGHVTPLHTHSSAHELFFVLAGIGEAVFGAGNMGSSSSNGSGSSGGDDVAEQRVRLSAGDVAVFPPGVLHGIDNPSGEQLYCLQMMLPNESFVEWVRSGEASGSLDVAALQRLAAAASCG